MANTANTTPSTTSLETQLQSLLTPSLLLQIHNIRFPYPKSSPINWPTVVNNLWSPDPSISRTLYQLCFPVWRAMAHMPFEPLLSLSLPALLLSPSSPDYLPHCLGLIYLLDASRSSFRGPDMRYAHFLFDPLAESTAAALFAEDPTAPARGTPSPTSPFSPHAWLCRGWSFAHYAARVDWLWAPLIHSEKYMSPPHRALNKGFILHLRSLVEAESGVSDPHAATQLADEADLFLLPRITGGEIPPPTASNLGREPGMPDYVFWMLRMNTAHFAIVERWGRYPYQNDQMGRLFGDEEEKWMEKAYPRGRLPEAWREEIRRDFVAGVWREWRGDGRERMGWVEEEGEGEGKGDEKGEGGGGVEG
ncbi:MAG: hypothetical protein Q9160_004173 [Pyrenula sp. 1 TL-2023]